MALLIRTIVNGKNSYTVEEPFLAHCGCGGAVNKAMDLLIQGAGIPSTIPRVKVKSNKDFMAYLGEEGFIARVPALSTNKFAVLIHPETKKALDIYGPTKRGKGNVAIQPIELWQTGKQVYDGN